MFRRWVTEGFPDTARLPPLLLLCALAVICPAFADDSTGAPGTEPPALTWVQAEERLLQVSDALSAADANVRGKQDLQEATRYLLSLIHI